MKSKAAAAVHSMTYHLWYCSDNNKKLKLQTTRCRWSINALHPSQDRKKWGGLHIQIIYYLRQANKRGSMVSVCANYFGFLFVLCLLCVHNRSMFHNPHLQAWWWSPKNTPGGEGTDVVSTTCPNLQLGFILLPSLLSTRAPSFDILPLIT